MEMERRLRTDHLGGVNALRREDEHLAGTDGYGFHRNGERLRAGDESKQDVRLPAAYSGDDGPGVVSVWRARRAGTVGHQIKRGFAGRYRQLMDELFARKRRSEGRHWPQRRHHQSPERLGCFGESFFVGNNAGDDLPYASNGLVHHIAHDRVLQNQTDHPASRKTTAYDRKEPGDDAGPGTSYQQIIKPPGKFRYAGRILAFDHKHRHAPDKGVLYEFRSAQQLLEDFFEDVDRILSKVSEP